MYWAHRAVFFAIAQLSCNFNHSTAVADTVSAFSEQRRHLLTFRFNLINLIAVVLYMLGKMTVNQSVWRSGDAEGSLYPLDF